MLIPLNIISIGIDDISFADIVLTIDLEYDFQVNLITMIHIKFNFPPAHLAVNKREVFDKIFKVNDAHWQDLLADDYRIDYIFMNKDSQIRATSARVIVIIF
jgi:hypothetical protein